ncbi:MULTISPECIES: SigE family RNA polymerase sigma factor [Actinomadura]|uniref:SigE family RNA polymerase sigma factor n=1 Tax=Actinomadura yumaensis TaxID=111807 RepID=A0ABW2CG22_9ACTN|nr:SigE family RNA polymerase sigma factor [Actinomadura sp. J1-007]MWK34727.1 SigE family RNA polymerase sigma factor [Actinomadura sp. J1-007]
MPQRDLGPFEEFVEHRLPALFRYACVLTGNRHDAEDLVQEALTRTGVGWWRVRRKDDPEGYVRTVMVRIVANGRRRAGRERLMASPPDRPVDDQDLDRVTGGAGFDAVLAGLPPRMRAVLVLRYVDQLDDAEIARVLGCTPGTVRSQAARALAKLREQALQERVDGGVREISRG